MIELSTVLLAIRREYMVWYYLLILFRSLTDCNLISHSSWTTSQACTGCLVSLTLRPQDALLAHPEFSMDGLERTDGWTGGGESLNLNLEATDSVQDVRSDSDGGGFDTTAWEEQIGDDLEAGFVDSETGKLLSSNWEDRRSSDLSVFKQLPSFSIDQEAYARALTAAQLNLQVRPPSLPWESNSVLHKGVLPAFASLERLFVRPNLLSTSIWRDQDIAEAEIREVRSLPTFPAAVRRIKDLKPSQAEDALRAKALARWALIISVCPEASAAGRTMIRMVGHLQSNEVLNKVVDDLTAKRAPSTVLKRAGSFLKFLSYCQSRGVAALPLNEDSCIDYCQALEVSNSTAATLILSFRQSLAFAGGVLQFDNGVQLASHPRLAGMEHKKLLKKRVLKQAATFKVLEVRFLMAIVVSPSFNDLKRLFAGHLLFCIFSRARWHDHQHIVTLEWDLVDHGRYGGFVQGNTRRSKTSTSAHQRTRFLPLTAVLWNFVEDTRLGTWWEHWKNIRERLDLLPGEDRPFLPAPQSSGGWCARPLSSGEATAWAREIFQELSMPSPLLSAHGCKATTLSWLAKFGVEPEVRLMLGYHRGNTSDSLLHYSRDALSGPLSKLNEVVQAIVEKRFFPDNNRAAYFGQGSAAVTSEPESRPVQSVDLGGTAVIEPLVVEDVDWPEGWEQVTDADINAKRIRVTPRSPASLQAETPTEIDRSDEVEPVSSDSDSSEASSDTSLDEDAIAANLAAHSAEPKEGVAGQWLHRRLGTLHRSHVSVKQKFACGRRITSAYTEAATSSFNWSKCSTCFPKNLH